MSTLNEIGLVDLGVEGQFVQASNQTLLCTARGNEGHTSRYVYKPVSGERPLWDFPDQTLAKREVAAFHLAELAGWHHVPETWWLDNGPLGPGMLQRWVENADYQPVVNIFAQQPPDHWIQILRAEDSQGQPVTLAHLADVALQRVALFDAILNNADRKAGHLLVDANSKLWAIDHGVTFHAEPKLRTVLWGWIGEAIPGPLVDELRILSARWGEHHTDFDELLTTEEIDAVRDRLQTLISSQMFPEPSSQWPAVPWPVF